MSSSGEHHVTPFKTYITVFASLFVLTIITVAISRVDLGALNMVVAMGVASVKAAIVVLWFMHQKYESNLNRVVFASGFFFLLLMFAFSAADIFTRDYLTSTFGQ